MTSSTPRIQQQLAQLHELCAQYSTQATKLVCVSKFHPAQAIQAAYEAGERDFGESRVQELCAKQAILPSDIHWHMIGHLQTNKVRAIMPFIHLIQSVDSERLLAVIEREAARINRHVDVLLEVHVAKEASKSGFLPEDLPSDFSPYPHVHVRGLMTMATYTDDEQEIRRCFSTVKALFDQHEEWDILSMGISEDYPIALQTGSTMVRIGSLIFGEREY